jgi:uncharacterized BrkB/YihY/UPF0761 family membrane protein
MDRIIEATKDRMQAMPLAIAVAILLVAGIGGVMVYEGLFVEGSATVAAIGAFFIGFALWRFYS